MNRAYRQFLNDRKRTEQDRRNAVAELDRMIAEGGGEMSETLLSIGDALDEAQDKTEGDSAFIEKVNSARRELDEIFG